MGRDDGVLVVGGANVDIHASAAQALMRGDSTPGRISFGAGGVARNVAENLARLGHRVRLISAVGDDAQGHALLASTREAGVDVSACLLLEGLHTAVYVSVHDRAGEMVAAVNQMHVLERLTPERLQPHAGSLAQAAAVVIDCNLSAETLGWVFDHRARTPVFADGVSAAKCQRLLPWLAQLHTLKLNRLEAQTISGLPADSPAGVQSASAWLHDRGVQQVVISLGERGLFHSARSDRDPVPPHQPQAWTVTPNGWQPAWPGRVLNATGAGDALMAGLVHARLVGLPLGAAARFGSACAAMALAAEGATPPGLSVAAIGAMLDTGESIGAGADDEQPPSTMTHFPQPP